VENSEEIFRVLQGVARMDKNDALPRPAEGKADAYFNN